MNEEFREMLRALRNPVRSRRREALMRLEREWGEDQVVRFCGFLRDLDAATCVDLCSVLADATVQPLVDLLGEFASRGEAFLSQRALQALEDIPGPLRIHCLTRLLGSPDEATRETACNLLGGSGSQGPRSDLVRRLQDPSPRVIVAALAALQRLDCRDVERDLAPLLAHPDEGVRVRTIEALVALTPEGEFPIKRLVGLLSFEQGETRRVRAAAAWALGKRPHESARQALIQKLQSGDDIEVRTAAAVALGAFGGEDVVRVLLIEGARSGSVPFTLACKRVLNTLDEGSILAVCAEMLRHPEAAVRFETAMTLGELSVAGAPAALIGDLDAESEPAVRAAVIEAIGNVGGVEGWDRVRRGVAEGPVVALASISALGALLDGPRVEEFIALFGQLEQETLRKAALGRLTRYGRTRGLPGSLRPALVPLFSSPRRDMVLLAAEAAGWVQEADVVLDLLAAMTGRQDPDLIRIASESVMRLVGGRPLALVQRTQGESLAQVAEVLRSTGSLGGEDEAVCRILAFLNSDGASAAAAALDAAGRINPEALVAAMAALPGGPAGAALRAWQGLPEDLRSRAPVNWVQLLRSAAADVRRVALEAMDADTGLGLLQMLVDTAVSDADIEVREAARRATRRVVGA